MKVLPCPRQHRCVPASMGLARQAGLVMRKQLSLLSMYQTSLRFLNKRVRFINKGAKWSSACSLSAPSTALILQGLGDRIGLWSIPPACLPERVCMWWERGRDQLEAVLWLNYNNFSKQHVRASQHILTLQGETGDTDSSEVWEILAVITKMKFDYVANTTAVQLHLK